MKRFGWVCLALSGPVGGTGCVQCDCLAPGLYVTVRDASTEACVTPTAVNATLNGESVPVEDVEWATCSSFLLPESDPLSEPGAEVVFTVEVGGQTVRETYVSPGASGGGCCGRGVWMEETLWVDAPPDDDWGGL